MALLLLELSAYPGFTAATKIDPCSDDGAFFLDFSRPLRVERWLGVWSFYVGTPCALHVPVIHNAERRADHVVAVERSNLYFTELRRLWKSRFPSDRVEPAAVADPAKIQADFACHFPSDGGPALLSPQPQP